MLARRLGLGDDVAGALAHAYERWDGKGYPDRLAGSDIPPETRVSIVARDADIFARLGEDVPARLRERRGKAYDPAAVDAVCRLGPVPLEVEWEQVLADEPEPVTRLNDVDRALTAVADFVDIKSPWTRGHSRRVAELAEGAGREAGLPDATVTQLRRAGLVHDLGRVGVGNDVWDKGRLATADWEKVRLHSYLTQRILARCEGLAGLGEVASSHHERMDGSGYHRASSHGQISVAARILAAADVMAAVTADRPHRPRLDLRAAVALLRAEAESDRLDARAVECVVAAAGAEPRPATVPGHLSPRELEVLRELARGSTNRQIGARLFISPKTVGRHVENIYSKIGVSTRAGATIFAMENRLLQ